MPKSKKKSSPARKKQKTYDYPGGDVVQAAHRHPRVSLILTIIVVGLLGWWGVKAVATELQFRQDKKQYAAAELGMARVHDQVVASTGEPVELLSDKTCGYTSAKFEGGALYCGFGYDYFYEVNTPQEGIDLALRTIEVLKSNNFVEDGFVPFIPSSQPEWSRKYSFTHNQGRVFGCGFSYELKEAGRHNEAVEQGSTIEPSFKKTVNTAYAAEMGFGCHSGAAKPLYQVEK